MLKERIKKGTLLFDGAMGTFLQKSGMAAGVLPEALNMEASELIADIHYRYLLAGADVLTTNTFGASPLKHDLDTKTVIHAAVSNAQKGIERYRAETGDSSEKFIALDLGPIGQLIEPMGTLTFEAAYESYAAQVKAGVEAGCDLILIETQTDIYEAKIAVLAAKACSTLPVVCTLSFEISGRTFMGTDVESMVAVLEDLGIDAIGFNCSFGPKEMLPLVEKLANETHLPILIQPNAGLPKTIDNITVYDTKPIEFMAVMREIRALGVAHLGGCCGTDETYISALKTVIQEMPTAPERKVTQRFRVASYAKTVEIGKAPVVIGERLNPTGKKRLKEALRNDERDYILKEAVKQIEEGAEILDLNIGLPEINEAELMPLLIKEIQGITDIPLQIDSSDIVCLEMAARKYNGKPLINSVSGKEASLEAVLPIVKKYGACVLGLTLDDSGIPSRAEARFAIAEKIVSRAVALGIPKHNIMIDCLALTASAQQEDVIETIKAIQMVKEKLGVPTVLGVSNVSFGLPYRQLLNQTFYVMAMTAGLDAAIINPGHSEMMSARDAFCVLKGWDVQSKHFIEAYGHITKRVEGNASPSNTMEQISAGASDGNDLFGLILKGMKGQASAQVASLLESKAPMHIVDEIIIPALNEVGQRFENGQIFLPQLIQSAETVQQAFERLKQDLMKTGESVSKGKIILATVHHDVHDIGKNIVKVILQNYGFDVIDLGKDVPPETVLEACEKHDVRVVGLSALMTSTVVSMEKTIALIKAKRPETCFIVGGAVLNPEYAAMIKADFYAKDARETAVIAQKLF